MLVLQKGLILPVPMYGGSYFFIQPDFVNATSHAKMLKKRRPAMICTQNSDTYL